MVTILIYLENYKYIDKTIDGLIDCTSPDLIDSIIICNDGTENYFRDGCKTIKTKELGRSKAWNIAARQVESDIIVFANDTIKFKEGWLEPLLAKVQPNNDTIASPLIYDLDTNFWSSLDNNPGKLTFRMDLSTYSYFSDSDSVLVSPQCFAISRFRFQELGMFDESLQYGQSIELSINNGMNSGSNFVLNSSVIAAPAVLSIPLDQRARIIEKWLPEYSKHFYSYNQTARNFGRSKAPQNKTVPSCDYINKHLPELERLPRYYGSAANKSVAVIGCGPSIDTIDKSAILKHDIIIAADYMGTVIESDFIVFDSLDVISTMQYKYPSHKYVCPTFLQDSLGHKPKKASDVFKDCLIFESDESTAALSHIIPPFFHHDTIFNSAVHFAIFLRPKTIHLYGFDNKIVNGKSHASSVHYYNDGILWSESAATKNRFARAETALSGLKDLAAKNHILMLRTNYA